MNKYHYIAASVALAVASPSFAQVAVADLEGAVGQSAAFQAARTQIETTYAAHIKAANDRNTQWIATLKPLQDELQKLQANPATPKATMEAKINAFRTQQAQAQKELAGLSAPYQKPTLYAQAQVSEKLDQAVKNAMTAKGIKVVVSPDAVLAFAPDANLTQAITAELNKLVPTASIAAPATWQPGQPTSAAAPATGR